MYILIVESMDGDQHVSLHPTKADAEHAARSHAQGLWEDEGRDRARSLWPVDGWRGTPPPADLSELWDWFSDYDVEVRLHSAEIEGGPSEELYLFRPATADAA